MSKLLKVGVIRGGVSTEREVSMNTGNEIIKYLNRNKYEVFDVVINSEREVFEKLENLNLDFVYIALHGMFGEDGRIQAILESLGIAYSGPGVMSSALCMDKELTKKMNQAAVELNFETAAKLRDEIIELKKHLVDLTAM